MAGETRPTRLTPEMRTAAARLLAKDLIKADELEPDEFEGAVRNIAAEGREGIDGYELAKLLDDHHVGWSPTATMVDVLDSFSFYARNEIEAAEKKWFERNPVEPPVPVGSRITLSSGETGQITGIYKHGPAKFLVAIDGDKMTGPETQGRRIVNFEDVFLLLETSAA